MAASDSLPPISSVSLHFRRRRMERFAREFGVGQETSVLDIGGAADTWRLLGRPPRVTLLNMPRAMEPSQGGEARVAATALALPFRDAAFDIVFSNSVIEHVGGWENQQAFAREAARVGRGYWIQTPNRWFPVEQHLLTPLIHWLPRGLQRAVVPHATVWGALARVTPDRREFFIRHYLEDVRLLGCGELRCLFPGARIVRERAAGFTKSLIALRKPDTMESCSIGTSPRTGD